MAAPEFRDGSMDACHGGCDGPPLLVCVPNANGGKKKNRGIR
jgi:hypothetical protein